MFEAQGDIGVMGGTGKTQNEKRLQTPEKSRLILVPSQGGTTKVGVKVRSHPHVLYLEQSDTTWTCQGRKHDGGCRREKQSKETSFTASTPAKSRSMGKESNNFRFRCGPCQYEICDQCKQFWQVQTQATEPKYVVRSIDSTETYVKGILVYSMDFFMEGERYEFEFGGYGYSKEFLFQFPIWTRRIGALICTQCSHLLFPQCDTDSEFFSVVDVDGKGVVECVGCSSCSNTTKNASSTERCLKCNKGVFSPQAWRVAYSEVIKSKNFLPNSILDDKELISTCVLQCNTCLGIIFLGSNEKGFLSYKSGNENKSSSVLDEWIGKSTKSHVLPICKGQFQPLPIRVPTTEVTQLTDIYLITPDEQKTMEQQFLRNANAGRLEEVKSYIDSKYNLEAVDRRGNTALLNASTEGHTAVVELLLQSKANSNYTNTAGITSLMAASKKGSAGIVRILLQNGADIAKATKKGDTALSIAIWKNKTEVALELIQAGAVCDRVDKFGDSLLMDASKFGNPELMTALIDKKGDVNHINENGQTALHLATQSGRSDAVQLLLDAGAECNAKDTKGFSPLHLASQQGVGECLDVLIAFGGNINAQDNVRKRTPLMWAVNEKHTECVRLLLTRGADVTIKDNGDATALDLATDKTMQTLLTQAHDGRDQANSDIKIDMSQTERDPLLHQTKFRNDDEKRKDLGSSGAVELLDLRESTKPSVRRQINLNGLFEVTFYNGAEERQIYDIDLKDQISAVLETNSIHSTKDGRNFDLMLAYLGDYFLPRDSQGVYITKIGIKAPQKGTSPLRHCIVFLSKGLPSPAWEEERRVFNDCTSEEEFKKRLKIFEAQEEKRADRAFAAKGLNKDVVRESEHKHGTPRQSGRFKRMSAIVMGPPKTQTEEKKLLLSGDSLAERQEINESLTMVLYFDLENSGDVELAELRELVEPFQASYIHFKFVAPFEDDDRKSKNIQLQYLEIIGYQTESDLGSLKKFNDLQTTDKFKILNKHFKTKNPEIEEILRVLRLSRLKVFDKIFDFVDIDSNGYLDYEEACCGCYSLFTDDLKNDPDIYSFFPPRAAFGNTLIARSEFPVWHTRIVTNAFKRIEGRKKRKRRRGSLVHDGQSPVYKEVETKDLVHPEEDQKDRKKWWKQLRHRVIEIENYEEVEEADCCAMAWSLIGRILFIIIFMPLIVGGLVFVEVNKYATRMCNPKNSKIQSVLLMVLALPFSLIGFAIPPAFGYVGFSSIPLYHYELRKRAGDVDISFLEGYLPGLLVYLCIFANWDLITKEILRIEFARYIGLRAKQRAHRGILSQFELKATRRKFLRMWVYYENKEPGWTNIEQEADDILNALGGIMQEQQYGDRRCPYLWVLSDWMLPATFAFVHAFIPGITRVASGGGFAGDDPEERLLTAFNVIVCVPAVFYICKRLAGLIRAYSIHISVFKAVAHVTDSRHAARSGLKHYIDLIKERNVAAWLAFRTLVMERRLKDPKGRDSDRLLGPILAFDLILLVTIAVRVILFKTTFDLFNVLALFDVLFLSTYIIWVILIGVQVNEVLRGEHVNVITNRKFKLAQEINDERDDVVRLQLRDKALLLDEALFELTHNDDSMKIFGLAIDKKMLVQVSGVVITGAASGIAQILQQQSAAIRKLNT